MTEGGYLGSLNALDPTGALVNKYIDWMTNTSSESDWDGHLKGALDNAAMFVAGDALLGVMGKSLKTGMGTVRSAMAAGGTSTADLVPRPPVAMAAPPVEATPPRLDIGSTASGADKIVSNVDASKIDTSGLSLEGEKPPSMTPKPGQPMEVDHDFRAGAIQNAGVSRAIRSLVNTVNTGKLQTTPNQLKTWLGSISDHLSDATPNGKFYKDLFATLSRHPLMTAKLVPEGTSGHDFNFKTYGSYNQYSDTMVLTQELQHPGVDPAHTVAHEAAHAVLMKQLEDAGPVVQEQLQNIARDALDSDVVQALKPQDRYGVHNLEKNGNVNLDEFMAEAHANPRFQQALKDTPSKHSPGQSLWDEYKHVAGHMLGITGAMIAAPQFDYILSAQERKA